MLSEEGEAVAVERWSARKSATTTKVTTKVQFKGIANMLQLFIFHD
jgi:hypothetical protein